MKRITALILGLSLAFTLCACRQNEITDGAENLTPAPVGIVSFNDSAMSDEMYKLLLSVKKSEALPSIFGEAEENPSFWETEDGHMYADMIKSDATEYAMSLMYYSAAFDTHALTLEESDIQARRDSYIKTYGGSEEALGKAVKDAGFSMELFNEYIEMTLRADAAAKYLHETSDIDPIHEEDYEKYFATHYITIRHLYLNNKTYAGGKALGEEQIKKINDRAAEIEKLLGEGADLADFRNETDDGVLQSYPDGITIPLDSDLYALADYSEGGNFNLYALYYYLIYQNADFTQAVLSAEEGEVTRVETADGIFFVQRLPIDTDDYEQYMPMIKNGSGVRTRKAAAVIAQQKENGSLAEDKDKIAGILIRDIDVMK